ncbi:cyclic nucleotide-binding domain-containing protein [Thermosipho ferrireducens]|uniref:Cyclic nucleotide-binding domain-containing protein n=1 Tax=Thermosipho ferrireducens TaxID=2571116 RepID=A0ABX7S6E8_9BACT|nr:cyclic nucleotide-binding domain-containing protein [Thermosipho ferrireducens]QTA38158.1 cyclic nucleotide-binding domain-containing protein [Thermosipho ferrireducens]
MKVQGIIFTINEVPKRLYKITKGSVREMRASGNVTLEPGDYVALPEYLLEIPLNGDIAAIDEVELIEVDLKTEFDKILKRLVNLRKAFKEASVTSVETLGDLDLDFETVDDLIDHVESLLSLSVGEIPDDEETALTLIETLDETKILTKANYVKRFVEKFPESRYGAPLLLDIAKKVYATVGDRYLTKLLCKKLLVFYPKDLEHCMDAINLLTLVYREEGNIIWMNYAKLSKILEVMLNEKS